MIQSNRSRERYRPNNHAITAIPIMSPYSTTSANDATLYTRRHLEIANLCGSRQQDVLRPYDHKPRGAKPDDCFVTEKGIVIWQTKTEKVQLKLFTPRLKHAVELARHYKANTRQSLTKKENSKSAHQAPTSFAKNPAADIHEVGSIPTGGVLNAKR